MTKKLPATPRRPTVHVEVGRRRQHRLEGRVVDDVDGRHAIALRKGAVEDLTHRHDGHGPWCSLFDSGDMTPLQTQRRASRR
jgi:hypothetical protein